MNLKDALIALVGTDIRAREILQILSERGVPAAQISVLLPGRAQGLELSYGEDHVLPVRALEDFDFGSISAVIVTDASAVKQTRTLVPKSVLFIDASGRAATDPDIAMALPGVRDADAGTRHAALPGAPSVPVATVLKILHDAFTVRRAHIAGFLSASHQGQPGMDELFAQTRSIYVNDVLAREIFPKQIAFNLVPEVGPFMPDGAVEDEWRMAVDIKRLVASGIGVAAQLAYAPVFLGHSCFVNVECGKDVDAEAALAVLRSSSYLSVVDLRAEGGTITPVEVQGEDKIFVSRVRDDSSLENGLQFWITADAVRACAAWPAVRLLEKMLKD